MRYSIALRLLPWVALLLMPAQHIFGQVPEIPAEVEKLPDGVIRYLGSTQFRHNYGASGIWSPDSKVIASNGDLSTCFWDVASGKLLGKIPKVSPCDYSRDGSLLVCMDWMDKCISVWDVAKKEKRCSVKVDGLVSAIFTADGKHVVCRVRKRAQDGGERPGPIRFYAADTGKFEREVSCGCSYYYGLQFSPDKKTIVTVEDYADIVFLDLDSGKVVRRLKLPDDFYAVDGLSVSPDGKWLAVHQSGTYNRNEEKGHPHLSRIIDLASGEEKYRFPLDDEWAECPIFSHDGKSLTRHVSSYPDREKSKPRIETIELASGKIVKTLPLPRNNLWATLSPDGRLLMLAGNATVLRVWTYPDLKPYLPINGHGDQVLVMRFTSDGKHLYSGSYNDGVIQWNLETGQPEAWSNTVGAKIISGDELVVSADGKYLITWRLSTPVNSRTTGSGFIYRYDTGQLVKKIDPMVGAAACSPDGKLLATGDDDGAIVIRDTATGEILRKLGENLHDARAIAFSPDSKLLARANGSGTVRLWSVDNGKLLFIMEVPLQSGGGQRGSMAFTPDGMFLAIAYESEPTQIWDVLTGWPASQPERGFRMGHSIFGSHLVTDHHGRLAEIRLNRKKDFPKTEESLEVFDVLSGLHQGVLAELLDWRGINLWETNVWSADGKLKASALPSGMIEISKARPLPHKWISVALPPEQIEQNWKDHRKLGPESFRAYLNLAGGDKAVANFIGSKIGPVKAVDAKQLIARLAERASDNADIWTRAASDLEANGLAIESELRDLLAKKDLSEKVRTQARDVLTRIEVQLAQAKWLQSFRAVSVLESIGNRTAREVLARLADGAAGARLTVRARQALARLDRVNGKERGGMD